MPLACGGGGPDDGGSALPPGAPTAIVAGPERSVGVVEGDTLLELHHVVTPFLLPAGDLAVPLREAGTIRVFGRDGAFRRALGRPGGGPGEFAELTSAWARGDTIEALDADARRITRFLPDGGVEVIPLEVQVRDLSAAAGPFGMGWVMGGVAEAGWGRRDLVVLRRVGRRGEDLGEAGRLDGMFRFMAPDYAGPAPLSTRAMIAVRGDRLYLADGDVPEIQVMDTAGRLDRVVPLAWPDAAAEPGVALRVVRDSMLVRAPAARRPVVQRTFDAAPVPDHLPRAWSVLVDDLGFVWIESYDPLVHAFLLGVPQRTSRSWRIVAPDGSPAGTLELPPGFRPTEITRDALVGIARDALDVESVRVYALRRR